MAGAIVLWLPNDPMEIGYLIHHMKQCLSSLFVVEWRVEAIRSKPTLYPVSVDSHEIRILFDLYCKIERRLPPPVNSSCFKLCRCIPRVRDIPPDHSIDV